MGNGSGQLNVTHALTAHGRLGDLYATALTNDALEADTLVLATGAFPVARRSEDLLTKEAVLLRLEGAVVDGFGLLDLTKRPTTNVVSSGQTDTKLVKSGCVEQFNSFLRFLSV